MNLISINPQQLLSHRKEDRDSETSLKTIRSNKVFKYLLGGRSKVESLLETFFSVEWPIECEWKLKRIENVAGNFDFSLIFHLISDFRVHRSHNLWTPPKKLQESKSKIEALSQDLLLA